MADDAEEDVVSGAGAGCLTYCLEIRAFSMKAGRMRIAVTGAPGLLGQQLTRTLGSDHCMLSLGRSDADITDGDAIHQAIFSFRPDLVIHAAAIRDLDTCETKPDFARSVNVFGTNNVLQAAVACDAEFCLISSDAVFSGERSTPYGENATASPCSVYGRTKLEAERMVACLPKHYVFRISALFGSGAPNFIEGVLRTVASGQEYFAATDQVGSATYTPDAAGVIKLVVERKCFGLFHLCSPGIYSRYELARIAVSIAGLDATKVVGRRRDEFNGVARRSEYSAMSMDRLLRCQIPLPRPVRHALAEYIRTVSF